MARADFEIVTEKPIGCGQFGTVFRARRRGDGRMAALKVILRQGQNGADAIAAERRGAILQQGFASMHGMVPEVFDHGPDGDDFFIAMELVEGASLEERLRGGALPYEDAVGHALWLCEFLDKAHAFSPVVEGRPYRLLHNDLKPAHLKIPDTGERKVLDFGIATALEETRELATDVGRTIAYAAPERLLSERVNVHADFWSLGVMLYEMAAGHRPYPTLEGPRYRRQLYSAITNNAPREALPRDCPPHLQAIVNRLLAFQPEHRYQRALEIHMDLERFVNGETPAAAAYFETPMTMPVTRTAGVAVADAPVTLAVPPAVPVVPATDPVPATGPRHEPIAATTAAGSIAASAAPRRSLLRRLATATATFVFLAIVATEGVACQFAEHFHDRIPTIDERTVISSRQAYEAVARWAVFDFGLRIRVNRPLAAALRVVGDRVIADYRREVPTMGPEEWRQAQAAFNWARAISHRDDGGLRSRELMADGHLLRLAAQKARPAGSGSSIAQAAVGRFRDAAQADPSSYDPYVAIAVTLVYTLGDVDGALSALDDASKRGYSPTRREAALIGDAYMRRGSAGYKRAAVLTGDERHEALVKARTDFERCVVSFAEIIDFGKAAHNLEACKAQMRRIDHQLDAAGF
jgi:hypothetical protein